MFTSVLRGGFAAGVLCCVVPALPARDVYGNNVPWTIHDDIIRDIQANRARAEARDRNSYSGKTPMEMWLEGKKEARQKLRQRITQSLEGNDDGESGNAPKRVSPPAETKISYEAWAEAKDPENTGLKSRLHFGQVTANCSTLRNRVLFVSLRVFVTNPPMPKPTRWGQRVPPSCCA